MRLPLLMDVITTVCGEVLLLRVSVVTARNSFSIDTLVGLLLILVSLNSSIAKGLSTEGNRLCSIFTGDGFPASAIMRITPCWLILLIRNARALLSFFCGISVLS